MDFDVVENVVIDVVIVFSTVPVVAVVAVVVVSPVRDVHRTQRGEDGLHLEMSALSLRTLM